MPRPDPEPGRQRVRMRVRVGRLAAGVVPALAGAAWQVRRGLSSGPAVGPWQVRLLAVVQAQAPRAEVNASAGGT